MAVTVRIPTPLRALVGGARELQVEGATLGEVLEHLGREHPQLAERLFDEQGELRRFLNVFVGEEDIRFLDGLATPLSHGETVSILPAVAGG
ncbi:MAG: ubiquitin-like small modifier protein 1 [Acidimicrobiia bacterium]